MSGRSTARSTRRRTSTRASSRCWSTNSVPAVGRWRRSTWSPTSTATTCRTCWAYLGRAQQGRRAPTGNGVRTELQADCYAGVWAHYAAITKQEGTDVTVPGTVERQGHSATPCRPPRRWATTASRRQSTGRVNPESWTHGSSEERQTWFTVGYQTGDPNKCDTFATQRPWLGAATAVDAVAERSLSDVSPAWILARQQKWHRRSRRRDHRLLPAGRGRPRRRRPLSLAGARRRPAPADEVDVVTARGDAGTPRRQPSSCTTPDWMSAGEYDVIASPLQSMRDVFDLMSTDTEDDLALIAGDCRSVPNASRATRGIARGHPDHSSAGRASGERGVRQSGRSPSCSSTWCRRRTGQQTTPCGAYSSALEPG